MNGLLILLFYLPRLHFHAVARLQVNELVGAVVEGKLFLGFAVGNVKQQHLVQVVAQVLQGRKQFVRLREIVEHIAKKHHQRTLVDFFGNLVQHVGHGSFAEGLGLLQKLIEFHKNLVNVRRRGLHLRLHFNFVRKSTQTHGIFLALEHISNAGGGHGAESNLAKIWLGIVHRRRRVYQQMAAQVGFFFVAFHKQTVGFGKNFPVNVPRTFARVIEAMLGKFDRKPVKRRFVQARNEALHQLLG